MIKYINNNSETLSSKSAFLILFSFLFFSCSEKKGSPYCSSCEKGKLYYSRGCTSSILFISDGGDSLYLGTNLAKKFHKDGISVCVRYNKKAGISIGCGAHEVKCITKIK